MFYHLKLHRTIKKKKKDSDVLWQVNKGKCVFLQIPVLREKKVKLSSQYTPVVVRMNGKYKKSSLVVNQPKSRILIQGVITRILFPTSNKNDV